MTARPDGTPRRLLEQAPSAVRPLAGADPDALRQMVQELVQATLERDFAHFLGAEPYARTDERRGVRNGSRPRTLVTRVGTLELRVPRDRASLFQPAVFARYQRHEQALLARSPSVTCRASARARSGAWSRRSAARRSAPHS